RSALATLRVLVPVLAAALLVVATLALFGVRLTLFHLVALLMVIGVGTNYALFFNRSQRDHDKRDLTLLSLGIASLATLISALALATSGTPVLNAIGLTAAVGTVYALSLAALLAPRA
ncbi:MAG: MMPL family transporter, partial [Burkholderiales bacterium]